VVTADDFGLAPEINRAVETAHQNGVLSAASLMVSGPAAFDAICRARSLPNLRIGLHVVLVDGKPTLPPEQIPELIDDNGRFQTDMVRLGINLFVRPAARKQLEAEVTAQFEAFRATGLPLDHANAHKHFHLHPTVGSTIIAVGKRFGLGALRVPREPHAVLLEAEPHHPARRNWPLAPWAELLAFRARRAGIRTPDAVFGLAWTGAMTSPRLASILEHLQEGRTEVYLHPATRNDFEGHAPGYRYADEFAGLMSLAAIAATRRPDVSLGGYADF